MLDNILETLLHRQGILVWFIVLSCHFSSIFFVMNFERFWRLARRKQCATVVIATNIITRPQIVSQRLELLLLLLSLYNLALKVPNHHFICSNRAISSSSDSLECVCRVLWAVTDRWALWSCPGVSKSLPKKGWRTINAFTLRRGRERERKEREGQVKLSCWLI